MHDMTAFRLPPPGISRRQALALAAAAAGTPWLADSANAAYVVKSWPSARAVPALDLADLDGKQWTLHALAGHVVLLNFWATWCEPCRIEMPSLSAIALAHRDAGLVVLAVNYKESAQTVRAFLEHMPYKATILLDADGDAATEWTPRVFPTTVLIGRDGKPMATVTGDLDWSSQAARDLVEPLLAAPRKAT
jgi:thiol-disulfide isomerase/thioredoxin